MTFHIRPLHEKEKKKRLHIPWGKLLALGIALGKPLYKLGERFYERRKHEEHMKRALSIGAAIIVALSILLLTFSLLIRVGGLSMGSVLQVTGTPIGADESGITNILLLGQGDETGQDLTDTIIIASIDPSTRASGTRSGQGSSAEWKKLKKCKGIVVPGGFGIRGVEGKIMAAHYARTKKIPYLGLCLGAQILAIEFARSVLKDKTLTSQEFDEEEKKDPMQYVVHFLPGQHKGRAKGGTLRLGAYECTLKKGSKAREAYGTRTIFERHRHRYEFNNDFKKKLEAKGLLFSGEWPGTGIMEIVEIKDHPFMLGSQFHPEFKSRPHRPHPLFKAFMEAVVG